VRDIFIILWPFYSRFCLLEDTHLVFHVATKYSKKMANTLSSLSFTAKEVSEPIVVWKQYSDFEALSDKVT
jgi:hypothetical protein